MSLRFRINIFVTLLMLLFLASTAIMQINDIKRQVREEIETGTKVTVQLLTIFLSSAQLNSSNSDKQMMVKGFLDNLGRVRAHEIQMINSLGDLVHVSPPSKYKVGRYAPEWFSKLVAPKLNTIIIPGNGFQVRVVPNVSRSIIDSWDDVRDMAILAVGFFLLLNILVFWIISRSLLPIESIVDALKKMSKGDLKTRLPDYPIAEFHSVTEGFNHMAVALESGNLENNRLALAIRQSSDALFITNPNGEINFWNPAASKLFGSSDYSFEEENITVLSPPELAHEVEDDLKQIQRKKSKSGYETFRNSIRGLSVEVFVQVSPIIQPSNDEVLGALFVIRDLSERRKAENVQKELEKNRELSILVQQKLEEERKALTLELHDELGQYITAIKSIAQSIANRTVKNDSKTYSSSTAIVSAAGQIYDAIHNIIQRLRPIALEKFGIRETLTEAVEQWNNIHEPIKFILRAESISLSQESEISLFRVAQECVNNSIKHSKASKIEITLNQSSRELETILIVKDDGIGISANRLENPDRFGIRGMKERMQSLGGELVIKTNSNIGTEIIATLPYSLTKSI
ncbi:MAG: hypothetical protein CBD16_03125 [Betaproteobacteria bacterium TMED156]|nr:MAG: hypothetical protein CBD16_03125 [Betaproteobacteria bacterium TMED156]